MAWQHVPGHLLAVIRQYHMLAFRGRVRRIQALPHLTGKYMAASVTEPAVFITSFTRHCVLVLSAVDGTVLRQWGSLGSREGQFRHPAGIVQAHSGQVAVVDSGNLRLQVFDAHGTFLRQWKLEQSSAMGAQVKVSSENHVVVADKQRVCVFEWSGVLLHAWQWTTNVHAFVPASLCTTLTGLALIMPRSPWDALWRVAIFTLDSGVRTLKETHLGRYKVRRCDVANQGHVIYKLEARGNANHTNWKLRAFRDDGVLLRRWTFDTVPAPPNSNHWVSPLNVRLMLVTVKGQTQFLCSKKETVGCSLIWFE